METYSRKRAYGRLTKFEERYFNTLNYVIFKKNQFLNFQRDEIKLAELHPNSSFFDNTNSSGVTKTIWGDRLITVEEKD